MQNAQQSDRLSWGDTVFLHLEREDMPLNVASVCIFDGEIKFEDCIRFVEAKLPLLPRYLKRVISAPLGLGLPSWEFDPDFDLRRHLRSVTLKRGSETELKGVAGKLFSTVMDRRHPLWDMTLVRGLSGNRSAIILRLHHCLADGIAGVGLMNVILDASPAPPRSQSNKNKLQVPPPRDVWTSLTAGVIDSYSDLVKRVLSGMADLLSMAERTASRGGAFGSGDELSRLLPELTAFTQRLRFNVPYKGPQKFAWTDVPLSDIKGIKQTFGTSVNDVLLALITASVRRYLEFHEERTKGRLFRMMVPVNLRGNDDATVLGNRISLVPITIPLDIRDPQKLLAAVHDRTEFIKRAHTAELISLAGGMIGMFPTALQALVGPMLSQLPVTPFNMVCTNVPGPQYPLYLLGHRMLRWYPYVPVGGEMSMNCAVLSYDGVANFGFSGDVHAVPDIKRLEDFLHASFIELREAAGMKVGRRTTRKRTAVRAVAKAGVNRSKVVGVAAPLKVDSHGGTQTQGAQKTESEKTAAHAA